MFEIFFLQETIFLLHAQLESIVIQYKKIICRLKYKLIELTTTIDSSERK